MAALVGYNVSLAVSAGAWTPVVTKSASGNITAASGGTAVTIPWVMNSNLGTGDTSSLRILDSIMAAVRAAMDDLATNGAPT